MLRNSIYIFLSFSFLISIVWIFLKTLRTSPTSECAFCNTELLNRQKIYEDDQVLLLYTHRPVLEGHCLIIPKRHIERFEELTDLEIQQIAQLIKKTNRIIGQTFHTSAYLVAQKNGREVGQSVDHVHFHYIPRKERSFWAFSFFFQIYLNSLKRPISTSSLEKIIARLKPLFLQEVRCSDNRVDANNEKLIYK